MEPPGLIGLSYTAVPCHTRFQRENSHFFLSRTL